MKKLLSILMVVCLFATFSAPCLASSEDSLASMADQHGFKNIKTSDLPENVKPIIINDKESLSQFVKNAEKASHIKKVIKLNNDANLRNIDSLVRFKSRRDDGETVTRNLKARKRLSPIDLNLYLKAKVKVYTHGSFREIVDVRNISTYIEGYSPGIDYDADSSSNGFDISSDHQSVDVWGGGDMEYYLLIDGMLKLYEKRFEIETTYEI